MNRKTEEQKNSSEIAEFSPAFLRWLIALTGATLLLAFAFSPRTNMSQWMIEHQVAFTSYPWVVAAGLTISHGLSEFGGHAVEAPGPTQRYTVLASLLLGLAIGPTLFFFGWRQTRLRKESGHGDSVTSPSSLTFILGGILTFWIALPVIPASIAQRMAASSLHKAQAIQSNRDYIINDMNRLKAVVVQYRILPRELGGGEGSFEGYTIPPELAASEDARYEVLNISPDEISFKGISTKYPGSSVVTTIDKTGKFHNWSYEGQFQ